MKQYKFTVHFKTGVENVTAGCTLDALMKAMLNRSHLQDKFASHIIDENGNKSTVDNDWLMRVIKQPLTPIYVQQM